MVSGVSTAREAGSEGSVVETAAASGGHHLGSRLVRVTVAVGALAALLGAGLVVWMLVTGLADDEPPHVVDETPVTAMDLRARRAETSPVVARDPTAPDFVVAATRTDSPQLGCGLQVSGDGGHSWVSVEAVGTLPEGLASCYAPRVGFGADGRLVFSFVGVTSESPPQPDGLFVVTSEDHAQTFSQPRKVADGVTFATGVAVGGQAVEAVWLQADDAVDGGDDPAWPVGHTVVAATGDVNGLADPVVVADTEGLVAAPTVVAGPNGEATITYYQLPDEARADDDVAALVGVGPWELMVAHRPSADQGFAEPMSVAEFEWPLQPELTSGELPQESPQPYLLSRWGIAEAGLAIGAGWVCVAWSDTAGDGGQLEALASCSQDGAQTWGEPIHLGHGLAADAGGATQWLPQLAISPSGMVESIFYANHGGQGSVLADVWYASSTKPGDGFAEPSRLTSTSSHPAAAPARLGWYGTRLGLASGSGATVAAWADSRSGLPVYPSQTIFSAVIDTPGPRPVAVRWLGAGLLAGGLLLVGAALLGRRRTPHAHEAADGEDNSDGDAITERTER